MNSHERRRRSRRGFTLIELLVVMGIIGLLLTLVLGGAVRFFLRARQSGSESLLQMVNSGLVARSESFWAKINPDPLTRHQILAGVPAALAPAGETLAVRYRRAKLIAKLEAMRGDFPQQFADFIAGRLVTGTFQNPGGGLANYDNAAGILDNVVPVPGRTRAAIERKYRELTFAALPAAVPNNNNRALPTQIAPHDPHTESAACLYLMLSVGGGEGLSFDIDAIPPKYIKDTDGDGVPEIVDDWGQPVRFYRWPTDFHYRTFFADHDYGNDARNSLDPDGLLLSRAWNQSALGAAFQANDPVAGTTLGGINFRAGNFFRVRSLADPTVPLSIPTWPIVVSAGADSVEAQADEKWTSFGLAWQGTSTAFTGGPYPLPAAPTGATLSLNYSWPPVTFLEARCGMPMDPAYFPAYFAAADQGAGHFGDNLVTRAQRAGREQ